MSAAAFIAGDWGTSHLRLFLCDEKGVPLESAAGPGAADVSGGFASTLDSMTSGWQEGAGSLPIVLCGMVGSSIGWTQTAYVPCPVRPAQIATACVPLREGRVHIVPGLSCRNRLGAPDLLRGEETQVLGALHLQPSLREGHRLLCLPGTHTKWVVLVDGSVTEFLTAPTGELFALICDHSVLVGHSHTGSLADGAAFERGLAEFARHPEAQLLHRVFECRSRRLSGDLAPEAAASYLSGLLIASDVSGAMNLLAKPATGAVHVIGSRALTSLYAKALAALNCPTHCIDGSEAAVAGLTHIHALLSRTITADAI